MRVITSQSHQAGTTVVRTLLDNERGLVIRCPLGQDRSRTVASIWNQLNEDERAAVAEAFGVQVFPLDEGRTP